MLVTNFRVGPGADERTDVRLRLSNLEAPTLTYAVDFVIHSDGDLQAPAPRLEARPENFFASPPGPADLLGTGKWSDTPWRRFQQLWIKTVQFPVPSGATRAIRLLGDWRAGLLPGLWPYQGYALLRLPARRDPRRLVRRIPQLDRPARALIAAEAVLVQMEWPPLAQRFAGYAPPRSLVDASREPVYVPAARPGSEIVHSLALGPGRAEIELVPEGTRTVERIEAERAGAALVDRLERGEAVLGADGFDATDRLAAFLDEIASLGDDPNSVGAMNAFLAQQGSRLQLSVPRDPNQPRRRPRR